MGKKPLFRNRIVLWTDRMLLPTELKIAAEQATGGVATDVEITVADAPELHEDYGPEVAKHFKNRKSKRLKGKVWRIELERPERRSVWVRAHTEQQAIDGLMRQPGEELWTLFEEGALNDTGELNVVAVFECDEDESGSADLDVR